MPRGLVLKNEVCEHTQRLASFTPFQTNFKISLMKYSISLHHKPKQVQFVRCYAKMAFMQRLELHKENLSKNKNLLLRSSGKKCGNAFSNPKSCDNAVPMRPNPNFIAPVCYIV